MTSKKRLTILTFLSTVLGFVGIFLFNCKNVKLGYDLALATFGSALLGLIMSLTEYFIEKRKAIDEFEKESKKVLRKLKKIKPVVITEPKDKLLACFAEEDKNKMAKMYGESTANALGMRITHTARCALIEWIEEHEQMSFTESDDKDAILNEIYENKMVSRRAMFEEVFNTYMELSDISLSELDNAYSNIDFLFDYKTIRQEAKEKVYDRIRSICNSITSEAYHFKLHKEGKGSLVVCARKAMELNEQLFKATERNVDGHQFICIYQKAFDEIDDTLEDIRCKAYVNAQKEEKEHYPVAGELISSEKNCK